MPAPVTAYRTAPDLGNVHPAQVWRAAELGGASLSTLDTGYAALNQVLPGSGWPQGALNEFMQPQAGLHEWGLMAPALAAAQAAAPRQLMVLIGAPYWPFGPALGARQISLQGVLCVQAGQVNQGKAPALLWAAYEALQCADVSVVLAWLPEARSAHLRRLHLAAQAHHKLLFVFRPLRAQHESSPAPLRLMLQGLVGQNANLQVNIFKRRGPPLASPVLLDTRACRLSELLAASALRQRQQPVVPAITALAAAADFSDFPGGSLHALDRTASLPA